MKTMSKISKRLTLIAHIVVTLSVLTIAVAFPPRSAHAYAKRCMFIVVFSGLGSGTFVKNYTRRLHTSVSGGAARKSSLQ